MKRLPRQVHLEEGSRCEPEVDQPTGASQGNGRDTKPQDIKNFHLALCVG